MPAVTARRRPVPGREEQGTRRHKPDYWLLAISVFLLAVGLIVVYSISPGLAMENDVPQSYYVNRQLIAVGLGLAAFFVIANLPLVTWKRLQVPLLVAAVAAAFAVRLFGDEVNGAYRWIQAGGFSFQAAELIKFALLIWVAGFLTARQREGTLADMKQTLVPLLIVLGAVGVVVGGLQSDFGSMAVMFAIIGAMAVVAGMPMKRILAFGAVVVLLGTVAILPFEYRQERLATFFNPAQDCLDEGYQSCQALNAVGSGGLGGLGLGRSVQAYGYLPEAENDSIFAIYAEKFGFIGVAVLLGLFVALFTRLKRIVDRAPDNFARLIVVGVFVWLSVQSIINIGAMLGLLPLKGITLPFVSYGGTSVLFVMAALGVVFYISRYTLYSIPEEVPGRQVNGDRYENSGDRRRVRGAYHPNSGRRA
jgi:cell division protein FtsW